MIKIAILCFHWLSSKGGPTTFVYNLVKTLRKRSNYAVFVITPDPCPKEGAINLKGKKLLLLLETFKALLKIKPNVIHVQNHAYMLLASIIYKLLFPSTRVISTAHTQPIKQYYLTDAQTRYKNMNIIKAKIFNWAWNRCNAVTSVSRDLAINLEKIQGLYFKRGVTIIPPGVRVPNINPSEIKEFKTAYKLNKTFPILCTIGVFEWDCKVVGIKILIESFKEVSKSYPKAKLIIVGDGKYRRYLENIVNKLGLQKEVIFTGLVDNPFIPLQIADIYCHISLNEGLPIAVLEAMAMGKPIIASNCGGIPEAITHKETGLLVEPDVLEITKAIQFLLSNKEFREKLGRNACQIAQKKYSWDRIADEFIKLYTE